MFPDQGGGPNNGQFDGEPTLGGRRKQDEKARVWDVELSSACLSPRSGHPDFSPHPETVRGLCGRRPASRASV